MVSSAAQPSPARHELKLRIASALVLAPLALAAEIFGGLVFAALVVLIAVLAYCEWASITSTGSLSPLHLVTAALLAAGLVVLAAGAARWGAALIAAPALFWMAAAAPHRPALWAGLGVAYVGLPCAAIVLLRQAEPFGWASILYVLLIVWATDTAAYFGGRGIGGPKLWPAVSPKKTWSGALAGLAGGVLAGTLVARFTGAGAIGAAALLALPLSMASQAGDLFESAIKRRFDVKDSGRVIPGHGGVLDRMDGVFGAAAAAWVLAIAGLGGELLKLPADMAVVGSAAS